MATEHKLADVYTEFTTRNETGPGFRQVRLDIEAIIQKLQIVQGQVASVPADSLASVSSSVGSLSLGRPSLGPGEFSSAPLSVLPIQNISQISQAVQPSLSGISEGESQQISLLGQLVGAQEQTNELLAGHNQDPAIIGE